MAEDIRLQRVNKVTLSQRHCDRLIITPEPAGEQILQIIHDKFGMS